MRLECAWHRLENDATNTYGWVERADEPRGLGVWMFRFEAFVRHIVEASCRVKMDHPQQHSTGSGIRLLWR